MTHRICLALAPVLVAALFVGCQSQTPEPTRMTDFSQVEAVPVLQQVQGNDSALTEPGVALITSREQLEALGSEELSQLDVDFEQQELVVVSLGQQPTGGYEVSIDALQQVGDDLYVQFTAQAPAEDEVVTQALTYPYAAAVIPSTGATTPLSDPRESIGADAE